MPLKKISALLLAAICFLFCACGGKEAEIHDSVSIWCSSELSGLADTLRLTAEEYNAQRKDGLLPVTVRCFDDEASFASAFDSIRPDFMLCSYLKAAELSERGGLTDISRDLHGTVVYSGPLEIQITNAGSSFFPIGSDTLMLLMNPSCFEHGVPKSLESLLSQAQEFSTLYSVPFLSADSYAHVFFSSMLQSGEEFHALEDKDIWNEEYKYIYNLFGEAAFSGALAADIRSGREAVENGELPCAVVFSSALVGIDPGYLISPLPDIDGASSIRWVNAYGLASVGSSDMRRESAAAFISWFNSEGRASRLALESGLVPAAASLPGWDNCPLSNSLIRVYTGYSLYLPSGGSDFIQNRDEFEIRIRQAYGILGRTLN